jgi:cation diffusion facilitator CzcD-associated flavoprotein CzcO
VRALIVGAGPSGLGAAKVFRQARLEFDCVDRSERIGGMWASGDRARAYRSLATNVSRPNLAYSDFPLPESWPDHPNVGQMGAYFERMAERFGLRERIELGREVVRARPSPDGRWQVELDGGEAREYDALVVATGRWSTPQLPDPPYPGTFDGPQLHSSAYRDPRDPVDLIGRRVLIVGMGNTSGDLAHELAAGRRGRSRALRAPLALARAQGARRQAASTRCSAGLARAPFPMNAIRRARGASSAR